MVSEGDNVAGHDKIVAFVHRGKPSPAQKGLGTHGRNLQDAVAERYREVSTYWFDGPCYGLVIYIVGTYNPKTHADADGISKRVWDGLERVAYKDDNIIRLRTNGILERQPSENGLGFDEFDLTAVPENAAAELLEAVAEGAKDIMYVQLSSTRASMFTAMAHLAGGQA